MVNKKGYLQEGVVGKPVIIFIFPDGVNVDDYLGCRIHFRGEV